MKVKLTYFKQSGKYYTDSEYETQLERSFEIFDEVRELRERGELPLNGTHWNILVEPQGENGYPHLIL